MPSSSDEQARAAVTDALGAILPGDVAQSIACVTHGTVARHLSPVHDGAAARSDDFTVHPRALDARCRRLIPAALHDVYARHAPSVEFAAPGQWVLLSQDDISAHATRLASRGQQRLVDVAFRCLGMGHVMTASCDPESGVVFEMRDGGSNAYDREAAFEAKVASPVAQLVAAPADDVARAGVVRRFANFETWWASVLD